MKNWNKKGKTEQLFLLCLIFIGAFGWLCITGCGGGSCETPKCGSEEIYGVKAVGISLPGCGGCLTSGRGCNSCLWPQSYKFISVYGDEESQEVQEEINFKGVDIRYYDGGCLGCGQEEKNCYSGYIKFKSDVEEGYMNGIVYGMGDGSENYIGCIGTCGGCVGTDDVGRTILDEVEYGIGVD